MTVIAICVDNRGKMYRIGAAEKRLRAARPWQRAWSLAAFPFACLRCVGRPPTEGRVIIRGRLGSLLGGHRLAGRPGTDRQDAKRICVRMNGATLRVGE